MDYLKLLEELLEKKRLEVSDGAAISCAETINLSISRVQSGQIIITFGSPYPYLLISKLGPISITEIKRKVNSISINKDSYTLSIDDFPDITRSRQ